MPDRRQMLACLSLGWTGALAIPTAAVQVPPLKDPGPGAGAGPGWRHQTLPKVERANDFEIVPDDGRRALRVRSSSSASSWVAGVDIDPARLPVLRWRWKVSRSLAGSDLNNKSGDDYAARLYVFFDLPVDRLSLADRLRIQAARLLSGAEIPAAALCYVWGHDQPVGTSAWNPYTDRVRMIVVDSGDAHAKQWRSVSRDVRQDWANAFGGTMPRVSGVGVGADTDNTGDSVEAWFSDLTFTEGP
jgi:hypothetical protein